MASKAPIPASAIQDLCAALQDFAEAVGEGFVIEDFHVVLNTHSELEQNTKITATQGESVEDIVLSFE